ncbi:NB-ARC domain-containing protein, partial [Planktothricoides raciborskii]
MLPTVFDPSMTKARLMEISESIKWIDDRIFAKTGKRLDSLQISILEATSRGQKYPQIAETYNFSNDHIRKAAWKLWKLLSDVLGEPVSQSNFRTLVQRGFFSNSNNYIVNSNNLNFCSDRYHPEVTKARSPTSSQPSPDTPTEPQINLDDAPAILTCYSRTTELNTLEHWIVQDRCRIVELLGMSGIGKTALSLGLIDQIKTNFDYIIYQTLCFSPTLETTLTNLLENFGKPTEIPQQLESKISQIFKYLRPHRCLIILDDVQMLFSPGKLAGEYQPSLENYPLFFKRIAEIEHSSCFLLISAEQLQEFTQLKKGDRSVRSLLLGGLGIAAKKILKQYELSDENQWEKLINLYQGNPLWLEMTAMMIQDLFAGNVADFLEY